MNPITNRNLFYFRIIGLVIGLALLIWLPFEDLQLTWVLIFALLITLTSSSYYATRIVYKSSRKFLSFILIGLVAGTSVSMIGFLLIAIKTGVHAHPEPDFTPQQIIQLIEFTPIFIIAGCLISIGAYLWSIARSNEAYNTTNSNQ